MPEIPFWVSVFIFIWKNKSSDYWAYYSSIFNFLKLHIVFIADAQFPLWKLYKSSLFFSLSTLLIFVFFFGNSHYGRCEVIPRWLRSHIFLMICDVGIFSCVWWPPVCLLWKHVQVLCPLPINSIFWCWVASFFVYFGCSICWIYCLQMSYPFQQAALHFVDSFSYGTKAFTWCSPICLFLLLLLCLIDISKNSTKTNVQEVNSVCFVLGVYGLRSFI